MTSEEHFVQSVSGAIYSSTFAKYGTWSRYLDVFDHVLVLARVTKQEPKENERRADGPGVSFRSLPDYTGPWQYLQVRRHARIIARHAIAECSAYLLRVPGLVSQMVWREIVHAKKPYALEVVGDPWDALSPGTWPHISRPIFRRVATYQLKRICAGATAVHYLTSQALQRRYPGSKHAYAVGFPDVMLESANGATDTMQNRHQRLRESPWRDVKNGSPLRIGFIGTLASLYKGPDTLLHAVALCQGRLNLQLEMVGNGRYLADMQTLAAKLSIGDHVTFRGEISSGRSIFEFLDSIDLFVMPSRQEGLPRALVEAMSRGCPCIASAVGGIPELLEASDLVPPNSPDKLAKLILQVAADSDRLLAMSARNLAKAAQFSPQTLNESRRAFLEEVKRRSSL
ncbi:MAG TPA: glycosyltransferase [Verrucomicrobiae bacterium]|jgi:glycosyltransferase involved in cell wall biosynthesis|nr:glycosyltransferase [Verrucomicrobiae bacterium]